MPRPYVEPQYDDQKQTEWIKLNDLKPGKYSVSKTLEKMRSYLGQPEKLVVYLELLVDGQTVMTTGNGKLKQMCQGSHICNINEGWILEVRGMIGSGTYTTRDVDLYQSGSDSDYQVLEDNIPF